MSLACLCLACEFGLSVCVWRVRGLLLYWTCKSDLFVCVCGGCQLDSAPGYVSDQGTSSGYASEAPARTPFACESHEPMAPWSGRSDGGGGGGGGGGSSGYATQRTGTAPAAPAGRSNASDASDGGYARPRSATAVPSDRDVILPWNMRVSSVSATYETKVYEYWSLDGTIVFMVHSGLCSRNLLFARRFPRFHNSYD